MNWEYTKNPEKRIMPISKSMGHWMKKNLFPTKGQAVITIVLISLVLKVLGPIMDWMIFNSIWSGDAATCRQGNGMCGVFLLEKARFILFGFYPHGEGWRPVLAIVIFLGMIIYSKEPVRWNKKLLRVWPAGLIWIWVLMAGGMFDLAPVETGKWGGLPLTLLLSFFGIVFSYPIGILLALGRRSDMPLIKSICVGYIELIRGVPMISLLFMSSVMFPLFLPEGIVIDKLLRAQVAIIMFVSAYMAEVVRGGLAAIPAGQYEAADSLGLSYWQKMRMIILPQALKIVIPPMVNTIIGMFKDTSLVVIIALFDLLMTTKTAIKDPDWLGFSVEAYLMAAVIYFIFCFSMGQYSRRLERELDRSLR